MGATLALGGVNPLTGERVVNEETCRHVLAVMTTAGLYQNSGDWLYDVGLPGKSGIGGGIITVAPGKGGLATFAPPLDEAGNSVRGQFAARFLSRASGSTSSCHGPKVQGPARDVAVSADPTAVLIARAVKNSTVPRLGGAAEHRGAWLAPNRTQEVAGSSPASSIGSPCKRCWFFAVATALRLAAFG